jgi:hypothetical protein
VRDCSTRREYPESRLQLEKGLLQGDSEASYRRCNRGNKLMSRYDQREHEAYLETRSASRDGGTWCSG